MTALLAVLLLAPVPYVSAVVEMNEENSSYIFDNNLHTVDAPVPYYLKAVLTASDFGAAQLTSLDDMSVAADGSLFLADGAAGTVYKLSSDLKTAASLTVFSDGTDEIRLESPVGVFASAAGNVYVADSQSGFIYVFDLDFNFRQKLAPPDKAEFFSETEYQPLKVCADTGGRVYVISANQTQGIMQFSPEGRFIGFLGATRVQPTLWDMFMRMIATREQRQGLLRLIPTEYNNFDIDEDSFIYATIGALPEERLYTAIRNGDGTVVPIRRLNPKGQDVLLRKGRYPPAGDVNFQLSYQVGREDTGEELRGPSKIVDVAYCVNGIYSLLDSRRGRIYTYNRDGDLLFMFGGIGTKKDRLITPTAINYRGYDIIVSDRETASVKIYTPTDYALKVFEAIDCHENGRFEEGTAIWNQVNREFIGSRLAYLGIGKTDMIRRDFRSAMNNFKLADYREYYSNAYKGFRKEWGYNNIGWIAGGLLMMVVVTILVRTVSKVKAKAHGETVLSSGEGVSLTRRAGYAKYIVFHPFKGFWDLKMRQIGTVGSATLILSAVVGLTLLDAVFSGYLFRPPDGNQNLLLQGFVSILLLAGLFVLASWCLTSLFDGKGNMRDIYIYTCYCLTPLLVTTPLRIFLSHILTYDESVLYSFIGALSVILVIFLIFTGTLTVHDYTPGKTAIMLIFTVVGMVILVFIALLCITLVQQIILYVQNIITELSLR
jgi:hypothetical protein